MTIKTTLLAAIASAAFAGIFGAAALADSPPDKSGGTTPLVLTLLNANDNLDGVPAVQRFVDRVKELSNGALTIHVQSTNDPKAGSEQRVVRAVVANKAQLAWVGTRVWDLFGVESFRALHAPMLIDSYALEGAVLRSDLPAKMLAGLEGHGVIGLALLGDNLRYPAGKRPVQGPADFKGLRIRSYPSATQWAALRTLGAKPSPEGWGQIPPAFRSGRLQALEIDLTTYEANGYAALAPYVTLNLPLWPRTTVLFANQGVFAKLTDQQRGWIQQAATDAAAYSLTTFGQDQRVIPAECRIGMRAVTATPTQLQALRKAFAPEYTALRKDPATAAMLDQILALKNGVHAVPLTIPAGCTAPSPARATAQTTFKTGVYRARRTALEIRRVWPSATPQEVKALAAIVTLSFDQGAFTLRLSGGGLPDCRNGSGRYSVTGQTIAVTFTDFHGCPLFHTPQRPIRLTWSYDGKTLRFDAPPSTPPDDRATWAAVPFLRIG